jgi:hypothetical protein
MGVACSHGLFIGVDYLWGCLYGCIGGVFAASSLYGVISWSSWVVFWRSLVFYLCWVMDG